MSAIDHHPASDIDRLDHHLDRHAGGRTTSGTSTGKGVGQSRVEGCAAADQNTAAENRH